MVSRSLRSHLDHRRREEPPREHPQATSPEELEHGGLIDRLVEPTRPVTIRYRLSARGSDLLASLQPLQQYGQCWEPSA